MGTLQFHLPPDLGGPAFDELRRAAFSGGQDNMPFLTEAVVEPGQLRVSRNEDESGSVLTPWAIDRAGTLMTGTATLIERNTPYSLVLELARGKVNQLRNQAFDWLFGGLNVPPALPGAIREATMSLGRAVACSPSPQSNQLAQSAINQAYGTADLLVNAYIQQVFQLRHQRQPRLDTTFGCRLLETKIPSETVTAALREACNTICLPLTWAAVEPAQADFQWTPQDQLLDWAITSGFHVVGGPMIDFHPALLPKWLLQREKSLAGIASFMCDYVATAVKRYKGRIRTWQLTAGSNSSSVLGLTEEEMLWLTLRIAEAARRGDPNVEVLIGLAQPWGDYLASQHRTHSPFVFADTLARAGLNLSGLNLELVMGVWPRGSYCRDLLEASRLIDLYSLLGLPLQITLGFPSDAGKDPQASQEMAINAGRWHGDFTPTLQAEWAEAFGRLALCKPSVRSVLWTHLQDAEPHLFPSCGLIDARGNVKPALAKLRQLRAAHLR